MWIWCVFDGCVMCWLFGVFGVGGVKLVNFFVICCGVGYFWGINV